MSGLLFAGDNDFFLSQGNNGNKMLCTKINGPVLVLFYSTQCQYCKKLIPIFKKLTGAIGQCSFAMVNIGKARQVIKDSTFTKNPIEYVPYIIFYVNNKPYMKYKGPPEESEIQKFAIQVCNNLTQRFTQQLRQNLNPQQNLQQNLQQNQHPQDHCDDILNEYTTTGTPLYGDDDDEKCYLNFDDAYPEEELKPGQKGDIRNNIKHYKKWEIAYPDVPYENYKTVPRKNVNPFAKQAQQQMMNAQMGKGQQIMAAQMAQQKQLQQQMINQQQITLNQQRQMIPNQQQHLNQRQMISNQQQQIMQNQQQQKMIPRQIPQKVSEMVHQQVLAQQRGPSQQNVYVQQMAQQRALYSHPTNTASLGKGKVSASGRRNVNRR